MFAFATLMTWYCAENISMITTKAWVNKTVQPATMLECLMVDILLFVKPGCRSATLQSLLHVCYAASSYTGQLRSEII